MAATATVSVPDKDKKTLETKSQEKEIAEKFFSRIFVISDKDIQLRTCFHYMLRHWMRPSSTSSPQDGVPAAAAAATTATIATQATSKTDDKETARHLAHFHYVDKSDSKLITRIITNLGDFQLAHPSMILTGEILTITCNLIQKCKTRWKDACGISNFYYHLVVCLFLAFSFWNESTQYDNLDEPWSRFFVTVSSALAYNQDFKACNQTKVDLDDPALLTFQRNYLQDLIARVVYHGIQCELEWGPQNQQLWGLACLISAVLNKLPTTTTTTISKK
jgi:hypothetical protein